MCIRLIMEKLHGGNWLLVDAKGREWGPKRCHKGGACKGLFYMRIIALLDKLESLNGPFSHYKPVGHETFLHNQQEFPIKYYMSCFSHTFQSFWSKIQNLIGLSKLKNMTLFPLKSGKNKATIQINILKSIRNYWLSML